MQFVFVYIIKILSDVYCNLIRICNENIVKCQDFFTNILLSFYQKYTRLSLHKGFVPHKTSFPQDIFPLGFF